VSGAGRTSPTSEVALRLVEDVADRYGTHVALDDAGRRWALGGESDIWLGSTSSAAAVSIGPDRPVYALGWSDDGAMLLAGLERYDLERETWLDVDDRTGAVLAASRPDLPDPQPRWSAVVAAASSGDGSQVLVATRRHPARDGSRGGGHGPVERLVALTVGAEGESATVLHAGSRENRALAIGRRFLAAGGDTVRVWERTSLELVAELRHDFVARDLAFDPDGGRLAVVTATGEVSIWEVDAANRSATYQAHERDAYAVAFHPSGSFLATGGQDGRLALWAPDGTPLHEERLDGWVETVAFSGDGTHLAATTWGRPPHLVIYAVNG